VLVALVVPLACSALVMHATSAAFTATTSNGTNAVTTGTVSLDSNDAGTALFTADNLRPGMTRSSCIQVTYNGTLPATVALYQDTPGGNGLDGYLNLTVTRGTVSGPDPFGECADFTPDSTDYTGDGPGVLYTGTLAAFPTGSGSAMPDPHTPAVPEAWTAGEAHAYRFTLAVQDTDTAQDLTTGTDITWRAVNTTSYSQLVMSDDPASYWKLDETNGTTAADATGVADGTYTSGPTLNQTTGVKNAGTAVGLTDASGSRITAGHNYDFGNREPYSLECWLAPTAATADWRMVMSNADWQAAPGLGSPGWGLMLQPTSYTPNAVHFERSDAAGGYDSLNSAAGLQVGTWHHVVVTYDGTTLRLYVNGALQDSNSSTRNSGNTGLGLDLGGSEGSPTSNVGGRLDEVAIYDHALSQQQVTEHYDTGRR
jgi:hypothetical protein